MKRKNREDRIRRTAALFLMEWKRGLRLVPSFFAALLLTAVILAAASVIFMRTLETGQLLPVIRVGVVIPDDDPLTGMVTGYVSGMDSVKSLAKFDYLDEERARKKLDEGELAVVILLPDNMYESVNSGENIPVHILFRKDSGLTAELFRNLITDGVRMLQTSEASIYAMAEVYAAYPADFHVGEQMNRMAEMYFRRIMKRGDLWEEETVTAFGDAEPATYYAAAGMLAILLLFGIGFSGMYDKAGRLTGQMLKRSGIGYVSQAAARLSAMVGILWILLLLLTIGTAYLLSRTMGTEFLRQLDTAGMYLSSHAASGAILLQLLRPAALGAALLLAFAAASFMHLIYGWVDGQASVAAYLLISIVLFILGGGLIPPAYIPAGFAFLQKILPISDCHALLIGILSGNPLHTENIYVLTGISIAACIIGTLGQIPDRT